MSALVVLRCVHVAFAVLGSGLIAAIAIAARPSSASAMPIGPELLASLSRWASVGLALVFLTGAGIDLAASGAFHRTWWFRLAGLSMIVAGAMLGRMRAVLRRFTSGPESRAELARVRALAIGACGVVAWIVVLMELRPFQ